MKEFLEVYKFFKGNVMCYVLVCVFGRVRCVIDIKFLKGVVVLIRLRIIDLGFIKIYYKKYFIF